MHYLFSVLIFCVCTLGIAQDIPDIPVTRPVNIHKKDTLLEVSIFVNRKEKVKIDRNKTYHWYAFDAIQHNEGAYEGNLLHGELKRYDAKYRLLERGRFDMGLKDGIWVQWSKEGVITLEQKWESGVLDGSTRYFEAGQLMKEEEYKDNLLHGKIIVYQGNEEAEELRYKKGILIVDDEEYDAEKEGFFKRMNKKMVAWKEKRQVKKEERQQAKAQEEIEQGQGVGEMNEEVVSER